jgi:hypoxanthine-DNA glycosylase
MPGDLSLKLGQYYAHPRNRFWQVMAALSGIDPLSKYSDRCDALQQAGVGLWDVIKTCERAGSLDGAIRRGSEVPNDFTGLLRTHDAIKALAFNGTKAFRVFQKLVAPSIQSLPVRLIALPSTSPANASWPFARLVEEWREITRFLAPGEIAS